jgi:hypothetical protein
MLTRTFVVTVASETPEQAEYAEHRIWDALQFLPLTFTVTQAEATAQVGSDWYHFPGRRPVDHGEQ